MTQSAHPADTTELLCYCEQVSNAQFAQLAGERSGETFADLCERTGVGMACTSCLLNAELAFTESHANLPTAHNTVAGRSATKPRQPTIGKASILQFLTNASPRIPARQRSVCPIDGGAGLRTLLTISNACPATIGVKSAPYRLNVEIHTADGAITDRQLYHIGPGDDLTVDLTDALSPDGSNDLVTGTARLTLSATKPLYRGTVRPHFAIAAAQSSAAVHTANAATHQSALHLISERGTSRNFVQVFNAEARPARAHLYRREIDGRPIDSLDRELAPLGSALVELPRLAATADADGGKIYTIQVDVDAIQRAWMIVMSGDMQRVSVDHI